MVFRLEPRAGCSPYPFLKRKQGYPPLPVVGGRIIHELFKHGPVEVDRFRTRSAARCLGSSLLLVRHLLLEAMPAPSSVRSLLVAMHLFLVAYCFYPHIVSDSFLLLLVRPLLLVAMPFAPARCPGSICPCPSMAEPAWRKGEKRLDRGPCCATRPKGECRIGALRPRCNEKLLVTTGIATRSKDATRSSWSFY